MVQQSQTKSSDLKQYQTQGVLIANYTNADEALIGVKRAIESAINIHYGIRAGLIDNELLEVVVIEIFKRLSNGLSVEDIAHAFDRVEIKADGWRNITKRQILEPLYLWNNKKAEIENEFKKFQQAEASLEEADKQLKEFIDTSLRLYKKAIESGSWGGDIFNASAIAKDYLADKLSPELKDELWGQAQRKKKAAEIESRENPENLITPEAIGFSTLRIFSELIVLKAIEFKLEL